MNKIQEDIKRMDREISLVCFCLYRIKKLIITMLVFVLLGLLTVFLL